MADLHAFNARVFLSRDGFCSGLVHSILKGMNHRMCIEMGAVLGALVQSTRGDTGIVILENIDHVMNSGSARIKR